MICDIIAARDSQNGIGFQGKLPWRFPEDMAHFKAITMGRCVIMGRKTWQSIPKGLPGRTCYVLSTGWFPVGEGASVFPHLKLAIQEAYGADHRPPLIIGGASLYAEALPWCDRIYLTEVLGAYPADVHFPVFDESAFCEESRRSSGDLTFRTLRRDLKLT